MTKPLISLYDRRYSDPTCDMIRGQAELLSPQYEQKCKDMGHEFYNRMVYYKAIVKHVRSCSSNPGNEYAPVYNLPFPESIQPLIDPMIWTDPEYDPWESKYTTTNRRMFNIYETMTCDNAHHPDHDLGNGSDFDTTYGSWIRLRYEMDEFIQDAAGWNQLVRQLARVAESEAKKYAVLYPELGVSTEWLRFLEVEKVEDTDVYVKADMVIRIFDPFLGCYPTLLFDTIYHQLDYYEQEGNFLYLNTTEQDIHAASKILKWQDGYEAVKLYITQNSTTGQAIHALFVAEFPDWKAWRAFWERTPNESEPVDENDYWDVRSIAYVDYVLSVESDYTNAFDPHHMLWLYWGILSVRYYYDLESPALFVALENDCIFNHLLRDAYQKIFGQRVIVPYLDFNQFREYVVEQGLLRWDIGYVKDAIYKQQSCYASAEFIFDATVEATEQWYGGLELDTLIHRVQEMYNRLAGQLLTFTSYWNDPSTGKQLKSSIQRYVFVPCETQGQFVHRLNAGFAEVLDIIDPLSRKTVKDLLIQAIVDFQWNREALPSLKVFISEHGEVHSNSYCLQGVFHATN